MYTKKPMCGSGQKKFSKNPSEIDEPHKEPLTFHLLFNWDPHKGEYSNPHITGDFIPEQYPFLNHGFFWSNWTSKVDPNFSDAKLLRMQTHLLNFLGSMTVTYNPFKNLWNLEALQHGKTWSSRIKHPWITRFENGQMWFLLLGRLELFMSDTEVVMNPLESKKDPKNIAWRFWLFIIQGEQSSRLPASQWEFRQS